MTGGNIREFQCKLCGDRAKEPKKEWKKKAQRDKRICTKCLTRRRIAKQTAMERAEYVGYGALRFNPFF